MQWTGQAGLGLRLSAVPSETRLGFLAEYQRTSPKSRNLLQGFSLILQQIIWSAYHVHEFCNLFNFLNEFAINYANVIFCGIILVYAWWSYVYV